MIYTTKYSSLLCWQRIPSTSMPAKCSPDMVIVATNRLRYRLARRIAPLPSAGDGARGRGGPVSRSRKPAAGRRGCSSWMVMGWCDTWEMRGKRHRSKAVGKGVVGGVRGGMVEGWVGVGQPQHGQDRRDEACCSCRAVQGAAHKSRRREHTRGNCLPKPLLYVSKAGRRKEGGGRGGTGILRIALCLGEVSEGCSIAGLLW